MSTDHTTVSAPDNTIPQPVVDGRARAKDGRHRGHSRKAIPVTPDALEAAAFAHGKDFARVAREVGCAVSTLMAKLGASETLRAAYERGRERAGVPVRARFKQASEAAATPAPPEVAPVSFDPDERSALIGRGTDDDLVLDAIRHGRRTVADILTFTGLTNARFRRSIDVLEHTMQIKARYGRAMLQHFYLATEESPRA